VSQAEGPSDDRTFLQALLDVLPDAVYFKDLNSRFIRINRALAEWYGLKNPDAAVGRSDEDYLPREFARATREVELSILQSGSPVTDVEEKFVGSDGKPRWVSTTKRPLRDPDGKIIGLLGISRDLGARKQVEEKLKDSAALYQSLIECVPQCVFRKDTEGRYVYVNRRLCEAMGKKPEDFLGKTDYDVNARPLAEKYRKDDRWVMKMQKTFQDTEDLRPKGKGRKASVRICVVKTPVYDSKGRVVGVQGMFWPAPQPGA
jgi:PAS domain S-box-containing protein